MRDEFSRLGRTWSKYIFGQWFGLRSLLGGDSEGGFEEIKERCLACTACANDENTTELSIQVKKEGDVKTYLNGVGSLRLRTLRGLLIVLTALLA